MFCRNMEEWSSSLVLWSKTPKMHEIAALKAFRKKKSENDVQNRVFVHFTIVLHNVHVLLKI